MQRYEVWFLFFFFSHTRSQLDNMLYKQIPRKGVRQLGPHVSFYSHLKKMKWEYKCWMRHEVMSDTCSEWVSGLVNGQTCNLIVVTQELWQNIWFNLSFSPCHSKEKPDSTVMYSEFMLQVSTGQSCWLTSMRGALSVTLQAFHYKNAWLLHHKMVNAAALRLTG